MQTSSIEAWKYVENAKVTAIRIGSGDHEGRHCISIVVGGPGWGQGFMPPFTIERQVRVALRAAVQGLARWLGYEVLP